MQELLFDWGFKGGKHEPGWTILEKSIYGLAVLALRTGNAEDIDDLKDKIARRVAEPDAPSQEIRDRTARNIKERARTLYDAGHWSSRIEHEMSRVDHTQMRPFLEEVAEILSPAVAQ